MVHINIKGLARVSMDKIYIAAEGRMNDIPEINPEQVKVHNDIVRCEKDKPLSLSGHRIYTHIVNMMRSGKAEITVDRSIASKCGLPLNHYKALMEDIKKEFFDFSIFINTDRGVLESRLISSAEKLFDGSYIFNVSEKLSPYMQDPDKDYTHLPLEFISLLNKNHAIPLYLLLSSYLYRKKDGSETFCFKMEIASVKKTCGIPLDHSSYKDNSNFKMRVLKPAIDDINAKTDIKVDYQFIKTGRKFTHVMFDLARRQASPSLPLSGALVRIPENIKTLLSSWDYKLVGKAKGFIENYIESYGAEVIHQAMLQIDKWPDQSFRAKMVKSLLPLYADEAQERKQKYQESLDKNSDLAQKEQLADLEADEFLHDVSKKWARFKLTSPKDYDLILSTVQDKPEFGFLKDKEDLIDKIAMSFWKEQFA